MKASERIKIPRKDLRRDVFRAGGPGGQAQNKISSAVRWTHKPSGINAESRTDRSQHANSEIAYERLCERLLAAWLLRQGTRSRLPAATFGTWRRSYRLVGNTQVCEDVELEVTLPRSRDVLDGGIDPFIQAALIQSAKERDGWVSNESD